MPALPERTCIGCGRVREKKDLLRLALEGRGFRIDPKGRLPGRGVYLCRESACVELAEKRHALARWVEASAARQIFDEVRGAVGGVRSDREASLLGLIGLANKAGVLAMGLRASVDAIRRGEGALLVTTRDISERGAREATRAAQEAGVPHLVVGTRAALGCELGSAEVVAALVLGREIARGIAKAAGIEGAKTAQT